MNYSNFKKKNPLNWYIKCLWLKKNNAAILDITIIIIQWLQLNRKFVKKAFAKSRYQSLNNSLSDHAERAKRYEVIFNKWNKNFHCLINIFWCPHWCIMSCSLDTAVPSIFLNMERKTMDCFTRIYNERNKVELHEKHKIVYWTTWRRFLFQNKMTSFNWIRAHIFSQTGIWKFNLMVI